MSIKKQQKILTIVNVGLMIGTVIILTITVPHHSYLLTVEQSPTHINIK